MKADAVVGAAGYKQPGCNENLFIKIAFAFSVNMMSLIVWSKHMKTSVIVVVTA